MPSNSSHNGATLTQTNFQRDARGGNPTRSIDRAVLISPKTKAHVPADGTDSALLGNEDFIIL